MLDASLEVVETNNKRNIKFFDLHDWIFTFSLKYSMPRGWDNREVDVRIVVVAIASLAQSALAAGQNDIESRTPLMCSKKRWIFGHKTGECTTLSFSRPQLLMSFKTVGGNNDFTPEVQTKASVIVVCCRMNSRAIFSPGTGRDIVILSIISGVVLARRLFTTRNVRVLERTRILLLNGVKQ